MKKRLHVLITLGVVSLLSASTPQDAAQGGRDMELGSGIGASCPWTTYEAEGGHTNGAVHGPGRDYLTPEAEASGRKYVRLDAAGQFVEIKATHPGNSIVVRYCIPDSSDGNGVDATLSLYVNGALKRKLNLTSRYAWVYGNFPWTNNPQDGKAHRFFDESHALIDPVSRGDTIRLQKDSTDEAAYYLIDFIELEQVAPPLPRPANSLSIADFAGLAECIQAAKTQGKIVWIPPGEFPVSSLSAGGVEIRGAGMWHSKLKASSRLFAGTGEPLKISDLALFGDVAHRNDRSPDNAFDGNLGDGSQLTRLWIEHFKCGIWTRYGTKNLHLTGCRIRNTMADGINLCDGTSDSVVEQCHFRNTGDDAMATWSPTGNWSSKQPCVHNQFLNNTAQLPWLANGIGLYGGADHVVAGNLIVDTVFSGGGILISSGHGAVPFSGNIQVKQNTLVRTGGEAYIGDKIGGLWFHLRDSDIEAEISINDLTIRDSRESAITVHGSRSLRRATLEHIVVDGAERAVHIKPGAKGSMTVSGLEASHLKKEPLQNDSPDGFKLVGSPCSK